MHIVLVEDDEVIRETTQIGLERFDYTVSAFADGREGYEFVAAHGADVLLLDLMLPTMNGASICRAVRERSTIPIIIISARSDAIDIVQALEAGADDYLTKPFDMQVLNARIRRRRSPLHHHRHRQTRLLPDDRDGRGARNRDRPRRHDHRRRHPRGARQPAPAWTLANDSRLSSSPTTRTWVRAENSPRRI